MKNVKYSIGAQAFICAVILIGLAAAWGMVSV